MVVPIFAVTGADTSRGAPVEGITAAPAETVTVVVDTVRSKPRIKRLLIESVTRVFTCSILAASVAASMLPGLLMRPKSCPQITPTARAAKISLAVSL